MKEELTGYGIEAYSPKLKEMHKDIMKLITSKKYKDIPADDCLRVFARVYTSFALAQLMDDKIIKLTNKVKKK